jgi:dihydroneopterin aldolase
MTDRTDGLDCIELNGLEVDCVVGCYPRERHLPQRLRLDLAMYFSTEQAARKEALSASIDYSAIAAQLGFLLRSCEFRLLETAAHALARYLLAPPALGERRAQLERVRLRLTKPFALGATVVPTLQIERDRSWLELPPREHKPFGVVEIIHETKDAGVYRLNIAPGSRIPLHVHRQMREAELVLTEGLHCQHQPVPMGAIHRWPKGAAHCYDNPTDRYQSILCVDAPRFIESDEIEVSGEPDRVEPDVWPEP